MDEYASIADVYDLWSADMTADVPFYVSEAVAAKGPVLEVGVGTGRVAVAMARAGAEVVGIDVSPSMLTRAKDRVDREELDGRISLVEADMRTVDLGRTFALVVLPYRVFCHALTTDEQVQTLTTLRNHLQPGGRLILNVPIPRAEDLDWRDGLRFEGRFTLDDGGTAVLWRQADYEPGTQLLHFRFVVDHVGEGGTITDRVYGESTVRQPSPGEIDHALHRAGFDVVDRWGWFDRRPVTAEGIEYVVGAVRVDHWRRDS